MDLKKLVLASMMATAAMGVTAAGVACYRHWSWPEQHHLAGLAALQIIFLAASVVFAAVTLRQEWPDLSPGGVAKGYFLALGVMGTAFLAVGVGLLVLGWLWTFGAALFHALFMRHPFAALGSIGAVYAIVHGWLRLHPGTRTYLVERLPWRRGRAEVERVT